MLQLNKEMEADSSSERGRRVGVKGSGSGWCHGIACMDAMVGVIFNLWLHPCASSGQCRQHAEQPLHICSFWRLVKEAECQLRAYERERRTERERDRERASLLATVAQFQTSKIMCVALIKGRQRQKVWLRICVLGRILIDLEAENETEKERERERMRKQREVE